MKRPSLKVIGGLLGILYFISTVLFAAFQSTDAEQASVIAQITNLHITILFVLLEKILPLALVSSSLFQLIVGLLVNYAMGSAIGWLLTKIFWREKIETTVIGVPM